MTWNTETCEECGYSSYSNHPVTGANMMDTYNGEMLCSICRVDKRLADGDFE